MSITLADIRMALPNFTKDELFELNKELCDIIKHKRVSASHEAIQFFRAGDRVSFEHKGATYKGVITETKRTRVVVRRDGETGDVSVPASWLKKCEPAFDPTTGAWN